MAPNCWWKILFGTGHKMELNTILQNHSLNFPSGPTAQTGLMAISREINIFGFRDLKLWILNITFIAVGGQHNNAFMIVFHSSNLYRDYLKKTALPQLDKLHNKTSNATDSLEKIYDKWNTDDQDHGNCTYGSGMNQVQSFSWQHAFDLLHMLLTTFSWTIN